MCDVSGFDIKEFWFNRVRHHELRHNFEIFTLIEGLSLKTPSCMHACIYIFTDYRFLILQTSGGLLDIFHIH